LRTRRVWGAYYDRRKTPGIALEAKPEDSGIEDYARNVFDLALSHHYVYGNHADSSVFVYKDRSDGGFYPQFPHRDPKGLQAGGPFTRFPATFSILRFNGDPAEYVRMVLAGERRPRDMFEMGCPSDGGWAEAVYDGLLAKAEADPLVRDNCWQP